MENISGHLHYLFLGKLSNTLTQAEEQELADFFSSNKDGKNEYEQFVMSLNLSQTPADFQRYGSNSFLENHLPPAIKKRRAMKVVWKSLKIAAIAASVAAIFIMTWVGMSSRENNDKISAAEKSVKTIQLQLASGEIIDLTQQRGDFKKDNLEFHNENGTLTYHAGDVGKEGMNTIAVPVGMDYKIILNDGSEVWMNSETTLQFPTKFSMDKREVSISGEAYLNIRSINKKPFIVNLPEGSVTVTGTSFNVNSYERSVTKVALVEGVVHFTADKRTVTIDPGMEITFNKPAGSIKQHPFSSKKVLSWQRGLYYFEDASLEEIAPVLRRWFGLKTKIDDPRLHKKRFSGVLDKNEGIQSFIDDLRAISDINPILNSNGELHFGSH